MIREGGIYIVELKVRTEKGPEYRRFVVAGAVDLQSAISMALREYPSAELMSARSDYDGVISE